jgi:peptidoglycan DL-endopeptidase CwlO
VFAHSRRAAMAALTTALLIASAPAPAAAADQRDLIVATSQSVIGARFKIGAEGPTRFDCSGLLWWTYSSTGLGDKIGGKRMRAREYQKWFRTRGLLKTDPKTARIGDLVFYGSPAKHSGIVTGFDKKGRPRVTSALTSGVATTRHNTLTVRFHSFGHVGLGVVTDPTPDPTPAPAPTPMPTESPAV